MIVGGDKDSSLDKKPLPEQPVDQPPPYVYRATFDTPGGSAFANTPPASTPPPAAVPEPVLPSPPFLTPPANFVSLAEIHNAVKGSWTVDTTLSPPPSFVRPASPVRSKPASSFFQKIAAFFPETPDRYVGPRPNLRLKSTHGRVDANVRIVRGNANSKPARIDVRSTHGSVRLAIMSRGTQRINLVAVSEHGTIEVFIPRDFVGLVRHRTKHGRFLPSDEVTACSTTFSLERGKGQTFIGDWHSLDFSNSLDHMDSKGHDDGAIVASIERMTDEVDGVSTTGPDEWPADLLTIDSQFAKLKVSFIDEQ